MRRIALAATCITLIATGTQSSTAAGRYDVALAPARQAAHVLNRAAFGPRPSDLAEIRRIGVERWIRQQLDPATIPDSTVLTAKLAPLATQKLATWQIFETYQPPLQQIRMATPNINQLLQPDQFRRLYNGASEERRAVIEGLSPEVRQQVLALVPPNVLDALPELRQQAERARQIQNEIRNREMLEQQRKQRPPLNELLTPEQARDLQFGTTDEKMAVLNSFSSEKRTLVFRSLPAQQVPDMFKREAIAAVNPRQAVVAELIEGKLQRAVYSPRQLEEVLVDFWLNHFNVFSGKNTVGMLLASYERDAIRPYVFGRFRDMLLATARHPAMLSYLDNFQSRSAPENAPTPGGVVIVGVSAGVPNQGLNENYGRELLELHTLGVNGGYTQADVINVARAFTGWTIFDPQRYGEFQFNPQMHDRAEKVVLGQKFPRGGGESEGVKIIDMLATHPSTARFISRKLAQRFVADDPPQALVDRMAATFTKTGGDLRAVLETLLLSREFMSEGAWQAKVKTPFELVTSALRALDADVTDTTALAQRLSEMGMPLYGRVDPAGYPNTAEAWSGSAGLLARINFANALTTGLISGVKADATALASQGVRHVLTDLTGSEPAAETVAAIEQGASGEKPNPNIIAGAIIASPDFQKR